MKENLYRLTKSVIWGTQYFVRYLRSLNIESKVKGSFLITIDIETAADFVHWMDKKSAVKKAGQNRKIIERLFAFSEEYGFPLTWFCTGHSLLENCRGHEPKVYPWATVENGFIEGYNRKDWFNEDPCKDYHSHPEWYFGDLFKKVANDPFCEIGSHTFGHIRADLASEKEFTDDLGELSLIHKKLGLWSLSFAYPWNKVGHTSTLKNLGVKVCRLKKGPFPSSITEPRGESPTSVYQSFEGRSASFPVLKFGIDLAVKKGLPFVWLVHPEELSGRSWEIFKRVADYVINLRQRKKLSILMMKEIAEPI